MIHMSSQDSAMPRIMCVEPLLNGIKSPDCALHCHVPDDKN